MGSKITGKLSFVQQFVQASNKENIKALHYCSLWVGGGDDDGGEGGGGASVDSPLKGPVMLNSTSVMTSTYMWSENDFCLLMLGLHQTPEGLEIYSP